MGRGEVVQWEDGRGVREERISSSEVGGMGRGDEAQQEDGWGDGDERNNSRLAVWVGEIQLDGRTGE